MKIIISPAKKLNTEINTANQKMNTNFLQQSKKLIAILKRYSVSEISSLMNVSESLANINWNRYQDWDEFNLNTYKAIDLFNGAVYNSMRIESFTKEDKNFLNSNLRILSGLYGVLNPDDYILPYRLEMGTKLNNEKGNSLYHFWGDMLRDYIQKDLEDQLLLNLASQEYSKTVSLNKLNNEVITPVFKDYKNGKLKVISFFAKKARGEMCNFIIKNKIINVSDIKSFNHCGYKFDSQENGEIIFVR